MDLSEFTIVHASANLEAHVNVHVTLGSPLRTGRSQAWIYSGRRLEIAIHMTFDGIQEFSGTGASPVMSMVQQILQKAPLWKQLFLEHASPSWQSLRRPNSSRAPSVLIVLQPVAQMASPNKPAARLLNGSPLNNMKPPFEVQCVPMHSLQLHIDLTTTSRELKISRCCKLSSAVGHISGQSQMTAHYDDHRALTDFIANGQDLESRYRFEVHDIKNIFTSRALVEILDAALRKSIQSCPISLAEGIRIIPRDASTNQYLANIAPAIACPGYLRDVAERACHIAHISRSIETYLKNTSNMRSSILGKIIAGTHPVQSHTVLTLRLWRLLSDMIYSKTAAYRLYPVTFEADDSPHINIAVSARQNVEQDVHDLEGYEVETYTDFDFFQGEVEALDCVREQRDRAVGNGRVSHLAVGIRRPSENSPDLRNATKKSRQ